MAEAAASRRGGRRPGAGRKPRGERALPIKSFTVDDATIAKIEAWKEARQLESASEALRQMVDLADRRRNAVRRHERRKRAQADAL